MDDNDTVVSGHTWSHHCCAAWSEGVLQTEDFNLQYVDKAVVMGLAKVLLANTFRSDYFTVHFVQSLKNDQLFPY